MLFLKEQPTCPLREISLERKTLLENQVLRTLVKSCFVLQCCLTDPPSLPHCLSSSRTSWSLHAVSQREHSLHWFCSVIFKTTRAAVSNSAVSPTEGSEMLPVRSENQTVFTYFAKSPGLLWKHAHFIRSSFSTGLNFFTTVCTHFHTGKFKRVKQKPKSVLSQLQEERS